MTKNDAPAATPSASPEQSHWAVIGAGMLGLALAKRLSDAGARVTLFEGAAEIGGLAGAWQLGDVVWDRHYHVTLLSDLKLRGLLAELGLESEMQWVETKTGFYTDGQLVSMSNTWEFLRFPPLGLIDKIRLGATIFFASKRKNWRPLERVLVADWLQKWSGRRTFEKIWKPLLLAKLGPRYQITSAAFLWATIARMYAARQSGLKKEMFGYVPGGYASVLAQFGKTLAEAGVEMRTATSVDRVVGSGDGRATVHFGETSAAFDGVVVTAPSAFVPRMLPELTDDERRLYEQTEYLGIVCASVLLKRPLASYYVTNITDSGLPFTAVIEMTTLVKPTEFGGRSLVYLPRYAGHDDEAWNWSDEKIRETFLAGLQRMYAGFSESDVEAFRVSRARHVMALPTLNYSSRLPSMTTSTPGVFVINSAHIVKGTLNVNEVIDLADDAFQRVLLPNLERLPSDPSPSRPNASRHESPPREPVARS